MSTHQSRITGGNGGDDSAGNEEFTSTQLSINTTGTDELLDEIDGLCLLYTSPSPRDRQKSRMPSSA